jgi:glutathione S-transferase
MCENLGRALMDQGVFSEAFNFEAHASVILMEKLWKPMLQGIPGDDAKHDAAVQSLRGSLDAYEVILGKQQYFAGDQLTLADLFHLSSGSLLSAAGNNDLTNEKRPNLARWWKELAERESWKAVKDGLKSTSFYGPP